MINLPYIPYIIFALVMIFGIYLGYKRGWRISVYAAVLSIIAFAVSYGLFTIFYESIASLISSILYDELGDPTYSWDDILVLGRTIIFTIALSIMYLPVVLILWAITYPVYKHFNKKNYPTELQKISENERIIAKPNNKINKLGGILIGTLTTTATASIFTSAVAAVFINSSTFSSLFSITDTIASVISGGNLGNPLAYQYLIDFLPYTKDAELMGSLSVLIRPDEFTLLSQAQIDKLNEEDHREALKNVLSVPESANALLDTIDQKGNEQVWKPLENQDDSSYLPTVSALSSLFTNNLKLQLSANEASNLVSWIMSSTIQNFEETIHYTNWKDAEQARIRAQEELKRREEIRDHIIANININVSDYNSLISELESYIVEHNQKFDLIPSMEIDRDNKMTIEISERGTRDLLESIMDGKERIMDDLHDDYIREKNTYDTLVKLRDDNEDTYKRLDTEIANHRSENDRLESEITTWERQVTTKEGELVRLEEEMDNKEDDKDDAYSEYTSATNSYNTALSNYRAAETELNSATTAWENAGKPTESDNSIYNRYKDAVEDEENKGNILTSAEREKDSKSDIYTKELNEYNTAISAVHSKEDEISDLEADIRSNESQIYTNDFWISQKTNQREAAYNNFISYGNDVTSQKPVMDDAEDDYDFASGEYNVAKGNYDRQYAIWSSANDSYNAAENLLATTVNRVNLLNDSLIPSTEGSINSSYSDIDELYQDLSNIKFSQIQISEINTSFTSLVSISGGNNSHWTIVKPSITKTTYTEDASTENDSIPFQEDLITVLLEDEAALLIIRDMKHEEFDNTVDDYETLLKKVLVQV